MKDIEGDVGAGVADVAEIVGSNAADVHADLAFFSGLELLLLLRHRVEELERHRLRFLHPLPKP